MFNSLLSLFNPFLTFIYQTLALVKSSLFFDTRCDRCHASRMQQPLFAFPHENVCSVCCALSVIKALGEIIFIPSVIQGDLFAPSPYINPVIICGVNILYPLLRKTVNPAALISN